MKIIFFSDIHIEECEGQSRKSWTKLQPLCLGPDLSGEAGFVDLVILAGDIAPIESPSHATVQMYAYQVARFLGCPVVLVPGNHEYYGGVFPRDPDALIAASSGIVTYLDRGAVHFSDDRTGLRVLGATLWTDYALYGNPLVGMRDAERVVADHRLIRRPDGSYFRAADALTEHLLSRQWLTDRLTEPYNGITLVVTHHPPHPAALNPNVAVRDPYAVAFASDCVELLTVAAGAGVAAWISGHTHHCIDVTIGAVRMLSAQRGHLREDLGWTGPGILML